MIRLYNNLAVLLISCFLFFTGCNKPTPPEQTCIAFATAEMIEWQGCDDSEPSVLFFPNASPLFEGDMSASTYLGDGYLQVNLPDNDYEKLRMSLSERMNLIIDAFNRHTYEDSLHGVLLPVVLKQKENFLQQFFSPNISGEGVYVTNPATGQKVLLLNVDYICFSNTALLPVLYK